MTPGYLEIYRIAADGLQILLSAAAVLMLMRYRKKPPLPDWTAWPQADGSAFRHEFMLQSLRHQSEQSFDNLDRALRSERSNLQRFLEIGDSRWTGAAEPSEDVSDPSPFQIGGEDAAGPAAENERRYEEVARLAAGGMNARRISKQLGIPLGEVELVVKLSAASDPATTGDRLRITDAQN